MNRSSGSNGPGAAPRARSASQGDLSHRLGTAGVEGDVRSRLELEPADHRRARPDTGGETAATAWGSRRCSAVPSADIRADVAGRGNRIEDVIDVRLVVDARPAAVSSVEVIGAVGPVVASGAYTTSCAGVDDRPVDVEDDRELVVRVRRTHPRDVLGERPHPVVVRHGAITAQLRCRSRWDVILVRQRWERSMNLSRRPCSSRCRRTWG